MGKMESGGKYDKSHLGRNQIMNGLVYHPMEFGFCAVADESPLKDLEQGSKVIRSVLQRLLWKHSGGWIGRS